MTKSKVVRAVLSLILAAALWAFVVGAVDPVTHITLNNVEITYLGESQLAGRGLSIEPEATEVSVTLEGSRSLVRPLKAGDIKVLGDVTDFEPGEHAVELTVQAPQGTEVTRVEPAQVTVKVSAGKKE